MSITPADASTATNTVTVSLTGGQTARFFINATSTNQNLVITEAATPNWESTANISCQNVTGSPNPTVDNATRTISANLNTSNSAAACTVVNTKRSRITLVKNVAGRADANDQFTVSASGGGTLARGATSATTSGTGTSASTTFYSNPNTTLTLTDTIAAGPSPLTVYKTSLTCTNAFTGPGATPNSSLPNNLISAGTSITPAPGDDITCTFTNTPRTLTLKKSWSNAIVSDAVNVTATGLTSLSSTATTTNKTDAGRCPDCPCRGRDHPRRQLPPPEAAQTTTRCSPAPAPAASPGTP